MANFVDVVEHYGAVGDGVTDCTDAFERAITAANDAHDDKGRFATKPGDGAEDKASTSNVEWKPTMSRAEAKEWAANSKAPGIYYHGTSKDAAAQISENGFDTGKIGSSSGDYGFYGAGIYVTGSDFTAQRYTSSGDTGHVLEMRVNTENPMPWEEARAYLTNNADADGISTKDLSEALTAEAKSRGYDSILVGQPIAPEAGQFVATSYTEVVIFDPKQIVIIDDAENLTAANDVHDERGRFGAKSGGESDAAKPATSEWKPVMSRAEAAAFAANSAIQEPLYHGAFQPEAAGQIRQEGFDAEEIGSTTGNRGAFGEGFYFTGDRSYATGYAGYRDESILETRVNVENPVDWQELDTLRKDRDISWSSENLAELAKSEGYDAIVFNGNDGSFTNSEVVVFDPQDIVVVDDSSPVTAANDVHDEAGRFATKSGSSSDDDEDEDKPTTADDDRPQIGGHAIVMSPEEADEWAKDSAVREPLFHGTSSENVESIQREGFRSSSTGFAGPGTYFTTHPGTTELFGETRIETRVNLRNPMSNDEFQNFIRSKEFEIQAVHHSPSQLIVNYAKSKGYDGIANAAQANTLERNSTTGKLERTNRVDYVVFDSANIVIVDPNLTAASRRQKRKPLPALRKTERNRLFAAAEEATATALHQLARGVKRHLKQDRPVTAAAFSIDDLEIISSLWPEIAERYLLPVITDTYDQASRRAALLLRVRLAAAVERYGERAVFDIVENSRTAFLATARLTLGQFGNDLLELARGSLVEGFTLGESIGELANRLQATIPELGEPMATVYARTNVVAASNAGSLAQARAMGAEAVQRKVWMCVDGSSVVQGAIRHVSRRWEDGPLLTLRGTARGLTGSGPSDCFLTVTPDHEVLTSRGWQRAKNLQVGDHLVSNGFSQGYGVSEPNVQDSPTTIEELYALAIMSAQAQRMVSVIDDFDGKRLNCEVDVVPVKRTLRDRVLTSLDEPLRQFALTTPDVTLVSLICNSPTSDNFIGQPKTTSLVVSKNVSGHGTLTIDTPPCLMNLDHGTFRNTLIPEDVTDCGSRVVVPFGNCSNRVPEEIFFYDLVSIEQTQIDGGRHVYDLETDVGWYFADGMIVHNSTDDGRTRESHAEADGQIVGINEQFEVGGELLDFPGDGSPENTYNCRCAIGYVEEDVDEKDLPESADEELEDQLAASAVTAAAQVHTGAMIALVPSEADCERMALAGYEEPSQIHTTLHFLGEGAD